MSSAFLDREIHDEKKGMPTQAWDMAPAIKLGGHGLATACPWRSRQIVATQMLRSTCSENVEFV
jgi:hypothetical protein